MEGSGKKLLLHPQGQLARDSGSPGDLGVSGTYLAGTLVPEPLSGLSELAMQSSPYSRLQGLRMQELEIEY